MGGNVPTVTKPKLKVVSGHLAHRPEWPTWKVRAYQWAPYVTVIVLTITAAMAFNAGRAMLGYAIAGEMACRQGALPEPQILCAADDLDCLTNPTVVEVSAIRDVIRERNGQLARACLRVM